MFITESVAFFTKTCFRDNVESERANILIIPQRKVLKIALILRKQWRKENDPSLKFRNALKNTISPSHSDVIY